MKVTHEVDTVDGQKALVRLRDNEGREWQAGAVFSSLRATDGDREERDWPRNPDDKYTIVSFTVVLPKEHE